MSDQNSEMLETNIRQKEYYELADGATTNSANNVATNAWRGLRGTFFSRLRAAGLADTIVDQQRTWFGDVAGMKVMDIGVGDGNPLSAELARAADDYLAIDLSESRLERFQESLRSDGIEGARIAAVDFLSPGFSEDSFDAIYAVGVVHHFSDLKHFLQVVHDKLKPGGIVVTHDPLDLWAPVGLLRKLYRPFQQDADWEWPFDMSALSEISARFEVLDARGIYGKSKWAVPLAFVVPDRATTLAKRWHDSDFGHNRRLDELGRCLQVTMKLQKQA